MKKNILKTWAEDHFKEVLTELKSEGIELKKENIPRIIEHMSFKKRSKRNPNKCPYYQKQPPKPCYNLKDLNCLLCACPNYNSDILEGGCKINSKKGKWAYHNNLPKGKVWDCSKCEINNTPKEVEEYLLKNLEKLIFYNS